MTRKMETSGFAKFMRHICQENHVNTVCQSCEIIDNAIDNGLTFGLFFFDVDLDGRLDILGANGHLEEEIEKTQRTLRYAQPPQLFWNAGRDAQTELVLLDEDCTGKSFCDPLVGRGASFGDFDNDGDQDVVISSSDGLARVFRNDQATNHRFLRFRLVGDDCNRDAIGASVTVKTTETVQTRVVMPTRSYLSQAEFELTFGLGQQAAVEKVMVQWPGGPSVAVSEFELDRLNVLQQ
ncbi:MAG: CRTAC1 family protein [Planctomycetota bacterium]